VVGTVVTFFDLGQGVGALILGSLVTRAGYTAPFVVGALAAVGALAVLSVHRRRDPSLWQPLR
jgi:predicted MFS family arabinose efflux permease